MDRDSSTGSAVALPGWFGFATSRRGDLVIRSIAFCITFLLVVVPLTPFTDLSALDALTAWEGGDLINQVAFLSIALLLALTVRAETFQYLTTLASPLLLAVLAWLVVSVITSQSPDISERRLAFTIIVMFIAAAWLVLPSGLRHFSTMLACLVIGILLVCYAGVLFAPEVSVHQSSDILEPELNGAWRGLFGHKNEAGAMMVLFFIFGLFLARVSSLAAGIAVSLASLVFLIFSG